jgi:hypothetical protein
MIKKHVLMILLTSMAVFSQKKPVELGVVLENDLYTSSINDKYYTNGFEIFYRFLTKNQNSKINKKILEFKVGQYIYNPQTINADDFYVNDRPFAGYLFGKIGFLNYYGSENVLKLNFQFGFVGQNAFGQETQSIFHKTFGYKKVRGWQYQINNALSVQGNIFYSQSIISAAKNLNFDLNLVGETNFGTTNTGTSIGFITRIGLKKLLPIYNSNLYNAALNTDKKASELERELYFYINPNLNYQLYDATIQGSLFKNDSPVTFPLMPFRFQGEAGFKYRNNKWNLSYIFVYRGQEAKNIVIEGYFYGSIGIGYFLN